MLGRRAVLAVSAIVVVAAGWGLGFLPGVVSAQGTAVPVQDPGTRFKSAVDLVSVSAVVRDKKGRFVPRLSREDFIVVEGGERRPIVGFNAEADGPVKVAVLFDISGSMRVGSKAVDAQAGRASSLQLAEAGRPGGTLRLRYAAREGHRLHDRLQGARGESRQGRAALRPDVALRCDRGNGQGGGRIDSGGVGKVPQRSAIVVLTDGIDTKSRLTAPEVSAIASSIDVPVYIVAVMSPVDDPRNPDYGTGALSSGLTDLARWTGGDFFIAISPAHASIAARQIVGEMRNQYMIAFEASARAGWRSLEVRARDREHTVRARSGYTAGGGSPSPDVGAATTVTGAGSGEVDIVLSFAFQR